MKELVSLAESAARAAGAILRSYFQQEYTITHKGLDDPVTNADTEADAFLKEKLLSACPDYGWLSEESVDSAERLTKSRVWIVDPLDGTKEFIAGRPEFMVSIGLAENGQPVLGVLYNPINDELFSAYKGQGAFLNGSRISCTQTKTISEARLIVSRSELIENLWQPYRHFFKTLQPCGSVAYKLALVASGKADIHISLKPKNEWDICAAHCLLAEAGAVLIGRDGMPIFYNLKYPIIPTGVIAGNKKLVVAGQKITQLKVCN